MHSDHAVFIEALEGLRKLTLTFDSKEDGHSLVRLCAPMDFGASTIAANKSVRYHFWDYDSDSAGGSHPLSLLPQQVRSIVATDISFEPSEFVTWAPRWIYARDWGAFS